MQSPGENISAGTSGTAEAEAVPCRRLVFPSWWAAEVGFLLESTVSLLEWVVCLYVTLPGRKSPLHGLRIPLTESVF